MDASDKKPDGVEFCARCGRTDYKVVTGSPEKYCQYCDWIFGQVCHPELLRMVNNKVLKVGDAFVDKITGEFYVWNGNKWVTALTAIQAEEARVKNEKSRRRAITRAKRIKKTLEEKATKEKEAAAEKEMSEWELRMKRIALEDKL